MASPYATGGAAVSAPVITTTTPTSMQKWYDQQHHTTHPQNNSNINTTSNHHLHNGTPSSSAAIGVEAGGDIRSVTPAMNNTRGGSFRGSPVAAPYNPATTGDSVRYDSRSGTPNRYLGAYNSPDGAAPGAATASHGGETPQPPSSTGLIRLSLRKPMGIVFEPMYDPNNPSLQRGVRICDLPRTGAAALSRKLEVGDELLSINDKTMSRLTFDEIMDFIIEADPEEVNLLFRRPRKETLQARHGSKKPVTSHHQPAVKWVDDDVRNKKKEKTKNNKESSRDKSKKSSSRRSKKEDEETITSQDEEYRRSSRKKGRTRRHPYESESFLDLLIDTICANPDHACRERRRGDEEYYSDEDEDGTFASQDDSTYVTYESEDQREQANKRRANSKKGRKEDSSIDEETEDDTIEEKWKRKQKREKEREREARANKSPAKENDKRAKSPEKPKLTDDKYEDDGTLETVDSQDRAKGIGPEVAPLGLNHPVQVPEPVEQVPAVMMQRPVSDDDVNPAPIKELEYDVDHGADVSVMESLGGPSLLIEKQRQAAIVAKEPSPAAGPPVPAEFIENYGKDYPVTFGLTHEQTIQANPLKFYTFVVKGLLQEHEPEKVRLLDKLLAKYKGREDHLVQKLSVRYNKSGEEQIHDIPEEEGQEHHHHEFENEQMAQHQSPPQSPEEPPSPVMSQPIMQPSEAQFAPDEWPEKETKEQDEGDSQDEDGSRSGGESEFSGDSIDGTSPAVIAQVSELLNYVYGKTSVPGQIDRVSTIMRAYEGREAVLLELLETKALIKANKEKENADNLPSFLRNSQAMQFNNTEDASAGGDMPPVTPMATQQHVGSGGTLINDDISSMSGVSSPAEGQQPGQLQLHTPVQQQHDNDANDSPGGPHHPSHSMDHELETPQKNKNRLAGHSDKKKKKGIFGGLFGGKKNKKNKDSAGALPASDSLRSGSRSRASRKLKNAGSAEVSI